MARFEVVGLYDCPFYAKAEKLADEIVAHNPSVEFHKEMLDKMTWTEFVAKMNMRQGWNIVKSPCIYEILADHEGKANLIGDINDFCEFAQMYFNIQFDVSSTALKDMVFTNQAKYNRGQHRQDTGDAEIFNIAIVNAPLQLLELLLPQLLSTCKMVPHGLLLNISIFDEYTPKRTLDGLIMEITDLASPLLYKAQVLTTLPAAFYKCHLFLLMEDFNKALMEETNDWLNRVEFKVARIMNAFQSRETKITDCRILVGGEGPSCYIAEICRKMASPSKCGSGKIACTGEFVCSRAKVELGKLGGFSPGAISRLHAYGWPGMVGCYVEAKYATVRAGTFMRGYAKDVPGTETPLVANEAIADYILSQFPQDYLKLQKRRLTYEVKQPNRFMCMAESAITTLHAWLLSDPTVRLMAAGIYNITPSAAELLADRFQAEAASIAVLNVGIECDSSNDDVAPFPVGTFMVQPAVCVRGKWQPLTEASLRYSPRVLSTVNNLRELRQKIIYRDLDISDIFPDHAELVKGMEGMKLAPLRPLIRETPKAEEEVENAGLELPGEGYNGYAYTTDEEGEPGYATDEVDMSFELTSDEN